MHQPPPQPTNRHNRPTARTNCKSNDLQEELPEIDQLVRQACAYEVRGGVENKSGKVNCLIQVSRASCRPEGQLFFLKLSSLTSITG